MGKSPLGAFGATTGKIGKLVTYLLRGQIVTRTIGKTKKKQSILQHASTLRLTTVNAFLKTIKGLINLGYRFEAEGSTSNPYNVATSYNMKNAIEGQYPNFKLDYSKVMISVGELKPVVNLSVLKNSQSLTVSWAYDSQADFSVRNDRAMILFVFSNSEEPIYFLSGSLRSEGNQIVDLGSKSLDGSCHVYVSFLAEDRESVSDSKYFYLS
ncbi:MAG: DUF6266 family protein [Pedobacter sp.]